MNQSERFLLGNMSAWDKKVCGCEKDEPTFSKFFPYLLLLVAPAGL